MRRAAAVGAALVGLGLLTGCTPAVDATVGVGYDDQGRLLGAVHVCDHDIATAELFAGDRRVGSWARDTPLRGTEAWRLADPAGPWASTSGDFGGLDPSATYSFSAWAADRGRRSNRLEFSVGDLARLRPGELLVERYSAPQRGSGIATRLEVIAADALDQERCWRGSRGL